jgi:hypothetical protein
MFKRDISTSDVRLIIEIGEIITVYLYDRPFPSYLILGYVDQRPIHLVVAKDDKVGRCIVITAYEPDMNIWQTGFKTKK